MIKKGDEVITASPLWHQGEDIGNRLGKVIDTQSYIVVDVYNYHSNPVKCLRHEVQLIEDREISQEEEWLNMESIMEDIDLDDALIDMLNSLIPLRD